MRTARPRPASPAQRGPLPLLLCLSALLCLPASSGASPPAGPGAAAVTGPAAADSVLAVVGGGPDGTVARHVTPAQFARAWRQAAPPVRPDSLTPAGARRFLDLLVGKEALGLMAAHEREPWTAEEQAGYAALRDQLVMRAVLDSALVATRAGLGPAADSLDWQAVGVLARERAVEGLGPVWDDSLAARLAAAFAALPPPSPDSSVAAQLRMLAALPAVDPADTGRVLARSSVGEYRASELLGAWERLRPVFRPRIRTAAEVRDLATNGLFERLLRLTAAGRGLEGRPDVAARLAAEREGIAVSHLVAREAYGRVPTDSLTLLRFWRAHEPDWALPTRVRCLSLVLADRAEANAMALRLRDEAGAESLAVQARRAGSRWLRDLTAAADSARFARAMRAGTGAVLGPDETAAGWEVARVMAVLPGRGQSFEECRDQVLARWYAEEGERRMQELLARARAAARVEIRPAALEALLADPPATLRSRP
mgnify:FL=1